METNGSILAPSVRLEVMPPDLSRADFVSSVDFGSPEGSLLVWSLYARGHDMLLFQTSDYTVSEDGRTATFSYKFPPMQNGDEYTIQQEVNIAMS